LFTGEPPLSQPLFRWNGDPVGFIENWQLFDNQGHYFGWIETDNSVWAADGQHVGQLFDGTHVFRTTTEPARMPRLPQVSPRRNTSPPDPLPTKIMPMPPMYGWIDAFDLFYPVPARRGTGRS